MVACTAFGAGTAHDHLGWSLLNISVLPLLALTLIATLWLRLRGRPAPVPAQA